MSFLGVSAYPRETDANEATSLKVAEKRRNSSASFWAAQRIYCPDCYQAFHLTDPEFLRVWCSEEGRNARKPAHSSMPFTTCGSHTYMGTHMLLYQGVKYPLTRVNGVRASWLQRVVLLVAYGLPNPPPKYETTIGPEDGVEDGW